MKCKRFNYKNNKNCSFYVGNYLNNAQCMAIQILDKNGEDINKSFFAMFWLLKVKHIYFH